MITQDLKQKTLQWASSFDVAVVLDNHQMPNACGLQSNEYIVAAGCLDKLICNEQQAFEQLKQFKEKHPNQWIFGFLTYDLKNDTEQLTSEHSDLIGFPALCFFTPQHLLVFNKEGVCVEGNHLLSEIEQTELLNTAINGSVALHQRVSKTNYLKTVEQLKEHIRAGDIYEINYCVEFYAQQVLIDPISLYQSLTACSPVPFAAFLKYQHQYLLCASPERFIKKQGQTLYSQPIKGTTKRGKTTQEDEHLKNELLHSEKERAENLMIVDLVRNDLARSSQTGTVKVEELFGIYTFPQVHQMISTVSSTIRPDINVVDAIKNAFPMGSMTGAPKISAMQLIEQYETTKRGLYSGAVGYFTPNDDFDFNVVIRSIQYNAQTQYLNFEVGGAITYDSIAEQEYEECLLKAKAMMEVLTNLNVK